MALDFSGLPLIFTSGALALISPCGFPMLPGYISYYMGAKTSLGKAISGGVACTLGLLTVFSIIGAGVSTFGLFIARYIPFLELLAGLIVIFMGITMIVEIRLPTFLTGLRAPKQRGVIGVFLYGVVYGLAALSCSVPIFISIIFYAVTAGGPLYSMITFIVYALGMGIPIMIITILAATAKKFMLEGMVKMVPWFQKISGIVLIIIGAYLIYFYYTSFYAV